MTDTRSERAKEREAFAARVRALEERAARDPRGYRASVLWWTALGYAWIVGLLALGAALLVGTIALLFAARKANFGVIKLLLVAGVLNYTLWKSLLIKVEGPRGIELSRAQAPALFALIDELRARLGVPRIHRVLIDDDLNAGVAEVPRLGVIPWFRRDLVLGHPLLAAVTPDELKAILAHELGHLSGRHGALGAFLYRLVRTWDQLLVSLHEAQSWLTKPTLKFFSWYMPHFHARTFVIRRQQEYEADRASAELVGARAAVDALVRTDLAATALHRFRRDLEKRARREPEAPRDLQAQQSRAVAHATALADADKLAQRALRAQTSFDDTHPALSDRARALGEAPRVPPVVSTSAGEALLGAGWAELTTHIDEMEHASMASGWRSAHEAAQAERTELVTLTALAVRTPEEQLRMIELLDNEGQGDDARAHAEALHEELSRDGADATLRTRARFQLASLWVDTHDERALPLLEELARTEPELRAMSHVMIARLHDERGDAARAAHAMETARDAYESAVEREQARSALREGDRVTHHGLAPAAVARLSSHVMQVGKIRRAWCVRKALDDDGPPVHALVIEVDAGLFEKKEEVAAQRVELLKHGLPVDTVAFIVATHLHPWARQLVDGRDDCRL